MPHAGRFCQPRRTGSLRSLVVGPPTRGRALAPSPRRNPSSHRRGGPPSPDRFRRAELHRVTGGPKHLWLARHYLDIRGRQDPVGRSRHNQSYRPVLEQSEAVGHAVTAATLMVSLVEVGVLRETAATST